MTPTLFRKAIATMGMSQGEAAIFMGVTRRTVNGWANGEPIPKTVEVLLSIMVDRQIAPADVAAPAAPP